MTQPKQGVVILGIFVADLTFRALRMPDIGETVAGSSFKMGPGGKGSNQAVAAARLGAKTTIISRLGVDEFAANALALWKKEGIETLVQQSAGLPTGAAFIYVHETSGENAIIVVPGAAAAISKADIEAAAETIGDAAVFITQLEQPIEAAIYALKVARKAKTITIFNPAPVEPVAPCVFKLCDYVTPNETEAAMLTGLPVDSIDDARKAADVLLARGAGAVLITLGEAGALYHTIERSILVPAINAGEVVETTGAGDAFNGGFAAALANNLCPIEAVRFGCAVAGISVTRAGAAPSMPTRNEVEAILNKAG